MALRLEVIIEEPGATDEASMIEACRRGDRRAIERVLRANLPRITRLVHRLVRDHAEAEDLVQSTLAGAVASFPRFRGDAPVASWLARIATHQVHELWRRQARRPATPHAPEHFAEVAHDDAIDLDAQVHARKQLARLDHHLAQLAPKKRLAFVLHVVEGRPVAEVAQLMDATETGTRSRVMWARRVLLKRLRVDPLMAELVEAWR